MKPLSGIEAEEFRTLKRFFDLLSPRMLPLELVTRDTDPVLILERMAAAAPARALKGLREAVRDLLEMTQDLRGPELAELDQFLSSNGAPTITQLRAVRVRALFKIQDTGIVRTEEDYRLLQTALSDMSSELLTPETRALGESLLAAYQPSS